MAWLVIAVPKYSSARFLPNPLKVVDGNGQDVDRSKLNGNYIITGASPKCLAIQDKNNNKCFYLCPNTVVLRYEVDGGNPPDLQKWVGKEVVISGTDECSVIFDEVTAKITIRSQTKMTVKLFPECVSAQCCYADGIYKVSSIGSKRLYLVHESGSRETEVVGSLTYEFNDQPMSIQDLQDAKIRIDSATEHCITATWLNKPRIPENTGDTFAGLLTVTDPHDAIKAIDAGGNDVAPSLLNGGSYIIDIIDSAYCMCCLTLKDSAFRTFRIIAKRYLEYSIDSIRITDLRPLHGKKVTMTSTGERTFWFKFVGESTTPANVTPLRLNPKQHTDWQKKSAQVIQRVLSTFQEKLVTELNAFMTLLEDVKKEMALSAPVFTPDQLASARDTVEDAKRRIAKLESTLNPFRQMKGCQMTEETIEQIVDSLDTNEFSTTVLVETINHMDGKEEVTLESIRENALEINRRLLECINDEILEKTKTRSNLRRHVTDLPDMRGYPEIT